ncbi:lycopene cyclase family protein [Arthrobacter sp. Br18]|uniref:lycopene cyclase family protein n=1 Tax=Arthrobacter sp. Br18 TaxID=1312954 RepID=UPI0009DF6386|nr:lycopene cyclase family protein [Arthrobacter sp. Br18]
MTPRVQEYDVVIAGGGLAGRSLAYYLSKEPGMAGARILIIDSSAPYPHRSLIYWHDGIPPLPLIPAASFTSLAVDAGTTQQILPLERHHLCLTSSRSVFRCLDEVIDANPRITRLDGQVSRVRSHADAVEVTLSDGRLVRASHCFDSTFPSTGVKARLLMSGEVRRVLTPHESFDPSVATFIDFRSGEHHPVHFHCVLPISTREAFVEVTRIVPSGVAGPEFPFEQATSAYLRSVWGVGDFSSLSVERGSIPLGIRSSSPRGRHLRTGTPSGVVKATTGYGFTRILRQAERIASSLASTGLPEAPRPDRRFRWYDKPVLRMWKHDPERAVQFMKAAFTSHDADLVLDFLDERTTFPQEKALLGSMPVTMLLQPRLWI